MKLKKKVLETIQNQPHHPYGFRELAGVLHVKKKDLGELAAILRHLTEKGLIIKDNRNRFKPATSHAAEGRLQMNPRGFGFVVFEDPALEDIYIPPMKLNGAFHGDIVRIREEFYKGKREGRVMEIVRRGFSLITGMTAAGYLMPLDRHLPDMISLDYPQGFERPADDTVITARITSYSPMAARAVDIIGPSDDPRIDDAVVFALYHLDHVVEDLEPEDISRKREALGKESLLRRDLTSLMTLTVDPADAKDHDDAVSVEETTNGWRLYVHIADVSFFLQEGGREDSHAFQRGFSVYCEDFYRPMLAPSVTGELCSLKEGEKRLALTVIMDISSEGEMTSSEIVPSLVSSDRFLSYEEMQSLLDEEENEKGAVAECARRMLACTRALNERRRSRAALDLDMPEIRIILDEMKNPVALEPLIRSWSHRIIEEAMIAANEAVASQLEKKGVSLLFRTHESPSEESLRKFSDLLSYFGFSLEGFSPEEINRLLERIASVPAGPFLKTQLLKSLKQARYTDKNTGHYGLQSASYTHFTSPIRRYPDLVIHRIIKGRSYTEEELFALGKSLSEKERVIGAAEQRSREIKILRYLDSHRDDPLKGVVTWVGEDRAAVELEGLSLEASVSLKSIKGDPRQLIPGMEGTAWVIETEPLTGYLEVELKI